MWARGRCRISPPRFLAECCKRQLKQVSLVLLYLGCLLFLICVGFVAAAVSIPMGGCRAIKPVGGRSLVSAGTIGVIVAAEPAVL